MTRLEAAFTAAAVILAPLGIASIYHDLWWEGGLFLIAAVIASEGAGRERRARRPRPCCQFAESSRGEAHSPDCTRAQTAPVASIGWEQRLARTGGVASECPPSSTGRCIAWDKCVTTEGECVEDRGGA